ncbi:hypothetical protein [Actinocrispum sp. NPDC049592]|uniref:hypothetical protein n=1 Tax=Actinocrispum sp. NPDC049592 TaxID=3154835 RepID=UPI0034416184
MGSVMTGFLNNNQGWWGFLALLVPFLPYLWRIGRTVRTARLSDQDRWRLLITTMRNDRSLVLRQRREQFQLPIRVVDAGNTALSEPATDLFALLKAGRCVEVVGDAGAGKSYLAVEVRRAALAVTEPDRVVDIVSAREWRKPRWTWLPDSGEATELASWASRALRRRYPHFRRSDLRRLIDEGRIVLAVDGLDEVDSDGAESLWQAIVGHASRLPVLVLRRSGGALSAVTAERLSFYGFARHTMRPLRERDVADLLRRRFTWFDRLAEAQRPHLIRQILTNPLLLHIAVQVWSPITPPQEVLTSTDPKFELWSAFLHERVGGSALSRHDPRLRRLLEAIALSTGSWASRLSDVNYNIRVRPLTIGLLALIALPVGWLVRWPDLAVIAVICASTGLSSHARSRVFGIPLPSFVRRSPSGLIVAALIGTVAGYVLALLAIRAVWLFVDLVAQLGPDPVAVLDEYGDLVVSAWWSSLPWVFDVQLVPFQIAALIVALTLLAVGSLLQSEGSGDDATIYLPGWGRLPFADRLWPRLVLIALLVLAFGLDYAPVFAFCVLLLAGVLYRVINLVFFAVRIRSVHCLSRRLLRGLDELGVLYADGARFRLVHQEIADNVARELLRDEKDMIRLARTVPYERGWDIVDASTRHQDVAWVRPLVQRLVRQYPQDEGLASQACLLLLYGIGDPAAAMEPVRRQQSDIGGAYLAEVYWSLRDMPRARALLDRTVRRFPANVFVLHQAASFLVFQNEMDAALRLLREAQTRVDDDTRWYFRTLAAVLVSAHDPAAGQAPETALAELQSLAEPGNPYHEMAELELARRWSEQFDEHQRALALLRPLEGIDSRSDAIVWSRMAEVHLRLGNDQLAFRYANRIMDELTWDLDLDHQLEAATVAAGATGDELAAQIADRLIGYGWPQPPRLHTIAADMRSLRARRVSPPESDQAATTGAP